MIRTKSVVFLNRMGIIYLKYRWIQEIYSVGYQMTEKEMKRLSRADLLEMLIDQSEELRRVKKRLRNAEAALREREIKIDNAGSIAEAALQLNNVFEAAQAACAQYTENLRALSERQTAINGELEREFSERMACRLSETERRCARLEAQTEDKCHRMIAEAQAEAQAYYTAVTGKIEKFFEESDSGGEHVQAPQQDEDRDYNRDYIIYEENEAAEGSADQPAEGGAGEGEI